MNIINAALKCCVLVLLLSPFSSFAASEPPAIKDDSFIVVWENAKAKPSRSKSYSGASFKTFKYLKTVDVVHKKANSDLKQQMAELAAMPGVKGVYPNFIRQASSFNTLTIFPDDPQFSELWGLNSGEDHDINAPEAWEVTTGSDEVFVVVIDTGIDYSHEDLAENMWVNIDEIPGNEIDDDGNGWVDDIYGIDTVNQDGDPMDDNSHGTHVAGTIAAKGNNAVGVTGVAWDTGLIACKFLDQFGFGSDDGALACLDYVLSLKQDKGLNIVATNNSWGGGGYSQPLYDAIFAQQEAGVLFVAAAGNAGIDTDIYTNYPSGYDLNNIISVAASESGGGLAWFSNYGASTVDIVAPGDGILSSVPGDSYEYFGGTSMAAPHVAGAVALLKANDAELNWSELKNTLLATARTNENYQGRVLTGDLRLWDEEGSGAINCDNQILVTRFSPAQSNTSVPIGESLQISVSSINCEAPVAPPQLTSNLGQIALVDDGTGDDVTANDGVFTASIDVTWLGENVFSFEGLEAANFSVTGFESPRFDDLDYNYTEINADDLGASDDSSHRIDLEFDIALPNGETTNFLNVWSNGLVAFDDNYYGYSNQALPLYYESHFFAPLWTDLYPGEAGILGYEIVGQSPDRKVIVEYKDFTDCCYFNNDEDYTVTFQVVFYESQSAIDVLYKDVTAPSIHGAHLGQGATIGYQFGAQSVQYSYNEAVLEDELGLRLVSAELTSLPTITDFSVDGLFRPFERLSINIELDDTGIEDAYSVQLNQNDGNGFQEVTEQQIALSLDAGVYQFDLSVANESSQYFRSLRFEIYPFSEIELELMDKAAALSRIDTLDEVLAVPSDFGLVSEADAIDRESQAQQAVVDDPNAFGLFSDSDVQTAISNAELAQLELIAQNPAMFGYVSVVQNGLDIQNAIVEGQTDVQNNAQDFGLTVIVNDAEDLAALESNKLHLVGLSTDIDDVTQVFTGVRFVWVYRDNSFVGWSPDAALREQVVNAGYTLLTSIEAGEGVWVSK